jgi:hypothetical protein
MSTIQKWWMYQIQDINLIVAATLHFCASSQTDLACLKVYKPTINV